MRPSAAFETAAPLVTIQSSASAHWLSLNDSGTAYVRTWSSLRLETVACDGHELAVGLFRAGRAQQLLDDAFALLVSALTVVMVSDPSFRVGDVDGGPVVVAERLPDGIVAVERDRVLHTHFGRGLTDVVDVTLEGELGRVHAHHHQPVTAVLLRPRPDIAERAKPVDAGVRPEVHEHDLPAQVVQAQMRRVEPTGGTLEPRKAALGRQRHPILVASLAEQAHAILSVDHDEQRLAFLDEDLNSAH